MPNTKKIQTVDSIVEKLKNNPNFVLFLFEKTSHKKMESLRKQFYEVGKNIKIQVVKNKLFKVAFKKAFKKEINLDDKAIKGSSGLINLPKEWNQVLSKFYKFAKEENTLSFKIGILDDILYGKEDLNKLANLPSKNELIAKIISSFKAPTSKTVMSMKFPMMKLVNILKNKK